MCKQKTSIRLRINIDAQPISRGGKSGRPAGHPYPPILDANLRLSLSRPPSILIFNAHYTPLQAVCTFKPPHPPFVSPTVICPSSDPLFPPFRLASGLPYAYTIIPRPPLECLPPSSSRPLINNIHVSALLPGTGAPTTQPASLHRRALDLLGSKLARSRTPRRRSFSNNIGQTASPQTYDERSPAPPHDSEPAPDIYRKKSLCAASDRRPIDPQPARLPLQS